MPPHNLDAEAAVLGSLMIDERQLESHPVGELAPEDFYREGHRQIFEAMIAAVQAAKPLDLVVVSEILQVRGELENVGGLSYLSGLCDSVSTAAYASFYANIVLEKSRLRQVIQLSGEVMARAFGEEGDAPTILADLESALTRFARGTRERGALDFWLEAEAIVNGQMGAPTHFVDLDRFTGGLTTPGLNIVAGRPSMGKSSLARAIVRGYVRRQKRVFYASYDQAGGQLYLLEACARARVSATDLRSGHCSQSDRDLVLAELAKVRDEWGEYVGLVDLPAPLERLISMARAAVRKGAELVVVDYVQLVSAAGDGETEVVSRVSKSLKGLGLECALPVIGVSQLSRTVESRPDKRPVMSDLRQSGQLEQDADQIWMLYRDEYYNPNGPDKNIAELLVRKHKTGPVGVVKLYFNAHYAEFRSLAYNNQPGGMP